MRGTREDAKNFLVGVTPLFRVEVMIIHFCTVVLIAIAQKKVSDMYVRQFLDVFRMPLKSVSVFY